MFPRAGRRRLAHTVSIGIVARIRTRALRALAGAVKPPAPHLTISTSWTSCSWYERPNLTTLPQHCSYLRCTSASSAFL